MESAAYLVVVQLLNRGQRGRSRQAIYKALGYSRGDIDRAIEELEGAGVLAASPLAVRATPALAKLDSLNIIAV